MHGDACRLVDHQHQAIAVKHARQHLFGGRLWRIHNDVWLSFLA
jgi:hypothetical protein